MGLHIEDHALKVAKLTRFAPAGARPFLQRSSPRPSFRRNPPLAPGVAAASHSPDKKREFGRKNLPMMIDQLPQEVDGVECRIMLLERLGEAVSHLIPAQRPVPPGVRLFPSACLVHCVHALCLRRAHKTHLFLQPQRKALFVVAQDVLDGLTYLHNNNIVHADVKEDNVCLCTLSAVVRWRPPLSKRRALA